MDPSLELQRGLQLHNAGKLAEAEAAYRRVLEASPHHPDALHLLGLIAHAAGNHDAATSLINQALTYRPDFAAGHYNLGRVLHTQGRLAEAATAYRRAIACRPDYAEAYNDLGGSLHGQGHLDEALACLQQALAIRPDYADAWSNSGAVLQDLGDLIRAEESYRRAISIKPDYVAALHNLGEVLRDQHRLDEAVEAYRAALALQPDNAEAHCGLSFALLARGHWPAGWAEYEWRWKHPEYADVRSFSALAWQGDDLQGRTILLYAEQGFGDTLQFIRYAPLVAARGGTVIVECQPALVRLVQEVDGVARAFARGETLPPFDVHAALLSLPYLFGTALSTIPADVPYLHLPSSLVRSWRARLGASGKFRVGLVWSSNPRHERRRAVRSVPLEALAPLSDVAGVEWISLQKGPAAAEAAKPIACMPIIDFSAELADFADTAALISHLDLVITVDTAVAHLAGALDKPVWVVLPFASEWRWLMDREDSPWYPSMRLLRQPRRSDWENVVARLVTELRQRLSKGMPSTN